MSIRAIEVKKCPKVIFDDYLVLAGHVTSGPDTLNVFDDFSEDDLMNQAVSCETLSIHSTESPKHVWMERYDSLLSETKRSIKIHFDPLSVGFCEDIGILQEFIVNGVPGAGTRLVLVTDFDVEEASKKSASTVTMDDLLARADARKVTILSKKG